MVSIVFKVFGELFRIIAFLIVAGTFAAALANIQKLAFESHHRGLISLTSINRQLVGK